VPSFVIQQHDASTLHYDFRLEVDGVLRSWAVPKGPSTSPRDKRLAVEVEDHSRAWGRFEGRIRAGYGRGAVIVWDRGTYENAGDVPMAEALEAGHAKFVLHGEKVRGGYALRRIGSGRKPQWLLIKMRDADADDARDLVAEAPESVVSGRTIDEL
jgi:DNA ligase D-like protein (predicted 3'-phosphoesterase)